MTEMRSVSGPSSIELELCRWRVWEASLDFVAVTLRVHVKKLTLLIQTQLLRQLTGCDRGMPTANLFKSAMVAKKIHVHDVLQASSLLDRLCTSFIQIGPNQVQMEQSAARLLATIKYRRCNY